jgi:putative endonuclease
MSTTTTIETGASAEDRAVALLASAGYAIVERNVECQIGELDIVARDPHGVLVFVEVRSRADAEHGHAAEMVGPRKRRRVARMARWYLHTRRPAFDEVRFDVVAITGDEIDHIADAWRV